MTTITRQLKAHAIFLGSRIDTRQLESGETLATSPLTIRVGENGFLVLFRFGVAVLFAVSPLEEAEAMRTLMPFVQSPFSVTERDSMDVEVRELGGETVDTQGVIQISELCPERVQILADVLAKSVILSHYEARVAKVFDRVESMANQLTQGQLSTNGKELLREIGGVLLIQTQTVGRADVLEKPELTWDNSDYNRLYERIVGEYELRERDRSLSRKLSVIARTAETLLELEQNRQSHRLEWYIIILIMTEIILSYFQLT
jgi:required for meiotic nuclear division protein 1